MKEKRSYIFYGSFEEAFEDIDDETELIVRRAISQYGLYKVEPELTGVASALFKLIAPVIDASQKRRKNGESGGRPKKEEETNGYENKKPMVTKEKTNGFEDVKPDKEVDVEVDVETEMDVDEEVENESSSTSSSSFLVLSSVTSDIHKTPTVKQIIKVLSDSGFSEYMAETAGNKFWNYFNGKNWSFLKYNSWTNKLEEWIPTEHILKDEYEKILNGRIKAQKEDEDHAMSRETAMSLIRSWKRSNSRSTREEIENACEIWRAYNEKHHSNRIWEELPGTANSTRDENDIPCLVMQNGDAYYADGSIVFSDELPFS